MPSFPVFVLLLAQRYNMFFICVAKQYSRTSNSCFLSFHCYVYNSISVTFHIVSVLRSRTCSHLCRVVFHDVILQLNIVSILHLMLYLRFVSHRCSNTFQNLSTSFHCYVQNSINVTFHIVSVLRCINSSHLCRVVFHDVILQLNIVSILYLMLHLRFVSYRFSITFQNLSTSFQCFV